MLCGQTSKTAREKLLLSLRVSLSYPFAVFCLQALFRLNRDFVEISCPYLVTSPNKLYVASHSTRALRPDIENRVRKASITPLYPYFRFLLPELYCVYGRSGAERRPKSHYPLFGRAVEPPFSGGGTLAGLPQTRVVRARTLFSGGVPPLTPVHGAYPDRSGPGFGAGVGASLGGG